MAGRDFHHPGRLPAVLGSVHEVIWSSRDWMCKSLSPVGFIGLDTLQCSRAPPGASAWAYSDGTVYSLPLGEELKQELERYERELPSLLAQEGRFVVIHGDDHTCKHFLQNAPPRLMEWSAPYSTEVVSLVEYANDEQCKGHRDRFRQELVPCRRHRPRRKDCAAKETWKGAASTVGSPVASLSGCDGVVSGLTALGTQIFSSWSRSVHYSSTVREALRQVQQERLQ